MFKKPKFRPRVTRIKLNPKQAVLTCSCFTQSWAASRTAPSYHASVDTYLVNIAVCNHDSIGGKGIWDIPGYGWHFCEPMVRDPKNFSMVKHGLFSSTSSS